MNKIRKNLLTLSQNPGMLLSILVLVNLLSIPYIEFMGDAKLYGIQILNRITSGAYSQDLFLKFGSHEKYSLVHGMLTSIVKVLGLDTTFLILFFLSKIVLFWGAIRFVCVATRDEDELTKVIAFGSLFLFAISPVPYGGLATFRINEQFFTPRILSFGLVLLSMSYGLETKHLAALGFSALGVVIHPIIGSAGVAIVPLHYLFTAVSSCDFEKIKKYFESAFSVIVTMSLIVGLGGFALFYELGPKIFVVMTQDWKSIVYAATPHLFLSNWAIDDWVRIIVPVAITLKFISHIPKNIRIVTYSTIVAGFFGLLLSWMGESKSYALLIQAQPWRWLWIVQFATIPLIAIIASKLWQEDSSLHRSMALILGIVSSSVMGYSMVDSRRLLSLLFSLPIFFILYHGVRRLPRDGAWLYKTVRGSIAAGLGFLLAAAICRIFAQGSRSYADFGPIQTYANFIGSLDSLILAAILLYLSPITSSKIANYVFTLIILLALVYVPKSLWYMENHNKDFWAIQEIKSYLLSNKNKNLEIYWPGHLEQIWFDLGTTSFFSLYQFSGCVFNEGVALEGTHRLLSVKGLEVQYYEQEKNTLSVARLKSIPIYFSSIMPVELTKIGKSGAYAVDNAWYGKDL